MTDGFEVLVQLVIAAMTTDPFSTVAVGLAATATVARPSVSYTHLTLPTICSV